MINEWIGLRLCPTEFKQTQSDMNKYITFLYKFAERKDTIKKGFPKYILVLHYSSGNYPPEMCLISKLYFSKADL